QQPDAFGASRVTANRTRIDIGSRGEHVHGDEQVVRAHGREVSPYEVRAFVRKPVSQKRTAVVRGGPVAPTRLPPELPRLRARHGDRCSRLTALNVQRYGQSLFFEYHYCRSAARAFREI